MPISDTCPASGRYGAVSLGGVITSTVRNWQTSIMQDSKSISASNTHGGTNRRPGLYDWNGNFQTFDGNPAAYPGQEFQFIGYAGPDDLGDIGGTGYGATGPALLESITTDWNFVANDPVTTTHNMVSKGPLLNYADASIWDGSDPLAVQASVCPMLLYKVSALGVIDANPIAICFQSVNFNLTSNPKEFANSCTGGWKSRMLGFYDWTAAFVVDEADTKKVKSVTVGATPLVPGDYVSARLYVNATQYWLLNYGIVESFNNYNVNIETGDIITYTINLQMSGCNAHDMTGATITGPDGFELWSPAEPTA